MSFLGEIRRRKVFQVAAVYAVVAWLAVQVITSIEAPLGLPDWVDTLVIVLLAIGFPISLIMSWSFNLTPEGLIRDAGGPKPVSGNTKAIEYVLIGLLVISVAWLLYRDFEDSESVEPVTLVDPSEPRPVVRFSIPLPDGQTLTPGATSMIALSSDGTKIAYGANNQIYIRNMDEREARPVLGTSESGLIAVTPAFSPDGQSLVFTHTDNVVFGRHIIKTVPIVGGAPAPIYEADGRAGFPHGLTWATPDTIIFASAEGIVGLPANGGETQVLISRDEDERFYSPQLLPGGEAVLFTRVAGLLGGMGGYESAEVVMQSVGRNDGTVVLEEGSAARYLSSGHLVYAQGSELFAIELDTHERAVRGTPIEMVGDLQRSINGFTDSANFVMSDTGTLVLIFAVANAGGGTGTTLSWVDRTGQEIEPLPVRPAAYTMARISPDETKVVLVIGGGPAQSAPSIWLFDLTTQSFGQLTAEPAGDSAPVWSSDSGRVFFTSSRNGSSAVYAIEIATGETTLVGSSPDGSGAPWSISPNDAMLALIRANANLGTSIDTLSVADGRFAQLLDGAVSYGEPAISPDGGWLAYHTFSPGADTEISIVPFPGADVAGRRIPVGMGLGPVFSRGGSELFYSSTGTSIVAASVDYDETNLRVETPQTLFESGEYHYIMLGRSWDVDFSGERFLMVRRVQSPQQIDVVRNWAVELEQRIPID